MNFCQKLFFVFFFLSMHVINAQTIRIKGKVIDTLSFNQGYNLLIINKTKNKGTFGSYTGNFDFFINKKDSFAISVTGYKLSTFCFKDTNISTINLKVYLQPLRFQSATIRVEALKTLEELKKDRKKLEKKETKKLSVINSIQSPITALYLAFSKREKSKRLLAELEYKESQSEIVKELLKIYVHHKIIDLDRDEFSKFIHFLNLNDHFLKTASDYDLVIYIKDKFSHYMRINDYYFED